MRKKRNLSSWPYLSQLLQGTYARELKERKIHNSSNIKFKRGRVVKHFIDSSKFYFILRPKILHTRPSWTLSDHAFGESSKMPVWWNHSFGKHKIFKRKQHINCKWIELKIPKDRKAFCLLLMARDIETVSYHLQAIHKQVPMSFCFLICAVFAMFVFQ